MAVACVAVLVVNAAISCSVRTEAGQEAVIGAIAATAGIAAVDRGNRSDCGDRGSCGDWSDSWCDRSDH